MSWTLLSVVVLGLGTWLLASVRRRAELHRFAHSREARRDAQEKGSHKAQLQYPQIDLSKCLGCGTCVAACPEEGVLDLLHGQAIVVHGARCVGHGLCAKECPTGAIQVALGDIDKRTDIPVLSESLESPQVPGLFLAGEVTGYALVRTAITHGIAIAREVDRRVKESETPEGSYDLCIVGAGPAGLACSLEAKSRGLSFVTLEQEQLGGTVASYPRRKLVLTQPVEMPLGIRLKSSSYQKEDLMAIWEAAVREHELPVHTGQVYQGLGRHSDGTLDVRTQTGSIRARHVCLALGRRGSPRKLGVPGEELPKVAYSLIDAQSYQGRRILVVGGGDSAIESALGLASQPGNEVVLSYRKHAFFRIKARNEANLNKAVEKGTLRVLYQSQVVRIDPDSVDMTVAEGEESKLYRLPNDEVFVFAGGIPPFKMLEESGISFSPEDRAPVPDAADKGNGTIRALLVATGLACAALAWAGWHSEYYSLEVPARPHAPLHTSLRPSGTLGLPFGILSALLILINLAYLIRRSPSIRFKLGSLQAWMTSHLVTGVTALTLAILHGAMAPQQTVGGHALLGLALLVVTGGIGRYFYSFVPHAANGRELALEEVQGQLAALASSWDRGHRDFGERIRANVQSLAGEQVLNASFFSRLWTLLRADRRLRKALVGWLAEGRDQGISEDQLENVATLARQAQRTSLMAAHYEDMRALLASWRYLHRWIALLMVLLVAAHIVSALRYGNLFG